MKKIIIFFVSLISLYSFTYASKENINISFKIKKIEAKYGGKIGLYTIDRNNWKNLAYQQNFYFPIYNTYKFLVAGAILKKSMIDKNLLNEKIKILPKQISGYSPITRKYIDKEISIEELCRASILSDNTASNLLIHKLGGLKKLHEFTLSLNDHTSKVAATERNVNKVDLTTNLNKTTPKLMAKNINKLAFSNDILDKKHRLLLKKWLKKNDTGDNRIAYETPDNSEISDKTSTCEYGTTYDVAIIWPENNRAIAMSIFYTQSKKNAKSNAKILQKVTKILLDKLKIAKKDKDDE
jgi:beta-lactamase class A